MPAGGREGGEGTGGMLSKARGSFSRTFELVAGNP